MSKDDSIFEKVKRGEISVDQFLKIIDRSVMDVINGLTKQVERLEEELLRKDGGIAEELRKITEDQAEIRRQIDQLQKQEWPPRPNAPGGDTLRKRQALLPAPTHSAPRHLM
jgi:hypothetical protein